MVDPGTTVIDQGRPWLTLLWLWLTAVDHVFNHGQPCIETMVDHGRHVTMVVPFNENVKPWSTIGL